MNYNDKHSFFKDNSLSGIMFLMKTSDIIFIILQASDSWDWNCVTDHDNLFFSKTDFFLNNNIA